MSSDTPEIASMGPLLCAEENARAQVYRLLAALLAAPPDEKMLALLRGIVPGDGELAEFWDGLRGAARTADSPTIEEEYHALFIGLGGGELSPYASKYLTGYLMERPLADLRTDLDRLGIARRDDQHEPEDHAAALCEAMALLITENELSLKEVSDFFDTHIGSWMERFFADLWQTASAGFYRSVGRLGEAFLRIEKFYFSMPV